jgi:adenylate cyclase
VSVDWEEEVERELRGDRLHSLQDVADALGGDLDFAAETRRALGLPVPEAGELVVGEAELDLARQGRALLDAGLAPADFLELSRVMSKAMGTVAAAFAGTWADSLARAGDSEADLGLRYAESLREIGPAAGPALQHMLGLQLREQIRQAVVVRAERAEGRLPGAQPITVCFADMVGFTRLGEAVDPDELGAIVHAFERLVDDAVAAPVRLVKTLGDGAMLVAPDADALLATALDLSERSEADESIPQLRIGLSAGEALPRAGDWYGRPVNLASRLTSFARRGSVVATESVRENAAGDYAWSFAGNRRFKGVEGDVTVYRVRRPTE